MFNNSIETPEINKKSINRSSPLSKAHIRPFSDVSVPRVEFYKGASLFRTTKARSCVAVGGPAGANKGLHAPI